MKNDIFQDCPLPDIREARIDPSLPVNVRFYS